MPVAVPEKFIGLALILEFFDRCHSLNSLYLPPAAHVSLPTGHLRTAGRSVGLPGKPSNANTKPRQKCRGFFLPASIHRTLADGRTIRWPTWKTK